MAFVVSGCQGLLAVVFLASGVSKLRGGRALRAFAASLAAMRLVSRSRAAFVATTLAAAEGCVTVLVAVPLTRQAGFAAAIALLAVLTTGVAVVLARGGGVPCRCFGASPAPLSGRHLVRNLLLVAVALAGLVLPAGSLALSGWLVAFLAGGLGGVIVTLLDDLVELFVPSPTS
ncbi:MauE/DoxX family redox-associated membrane protein [Microbispora hainanensis]|uniref:Methylamine utilization protein MauE n=1 Tax=Microbispora hainanensis TaxID=568844 RepID=A0A544XYB5_9ACTN|nr:methylamine utilization protein MauE [Microbispora hainanensis]